MPFHFGFFACVAALFFQPVFAQAATPRELVDRYLKTHSAVWTDRLPISVPESCFTYLKEIPTTQQTIWVQVPLDYEKPEGEKIWVFFQGEIDAAQRTENMPIMVHHGGPSSHSFNTAKLFWKNAPQLPRLSPIFMSQRGSGKWFDGCATSFSNRIESVSYYEKFTSPSSVMDAEVFRRVVLNGKRWKILGRSYGQQLVHATLQYFPETVTAAYIDAFTMTRDSRLNGSYVEYYRANRYQAFFTAHPELKKSIARVIREEQQRPCIGPDPLCLKEIFDNTEEEWLYDPAQWSRIENRLNERLRGSFLRELPAPVASTIPRAGLAANWALAYLDLTTANDESGDPWGYRRGFQAAYRWLAERDTDLALIYQQARLPLFQNTDEPWLSAWTTKIFADRKPSPVRLDLVKASLKRHRIPFVVYAGISDTMDSPYLFCPSLKSLGNLVQFKIRSGGHPAGFENPELWADLVQFPKRSGSIVETDQYCREVEFFAKKIAERL